MKQNDYEFFKENGYLSLGKILNDEEVARFADVFERERRDFSRFWTDNGIWQIQYCHSLLTAPELDEIIRHPKVMEPLKVLMGDEVCFAQIHLNHIAATAAVGTSARFAGAKRIKMRAVGAIQSRHCAACLLVILWW